MTKFVRFENKKW